MRYLRARIQGIQTKSLRCLMDREEVTESQLLENISDGEHTYRRWISNSMSSTFSLRDPKLYDFSLSLLTKEVLLGIESAAIVSIEPVKEADACHICNNLTLKRDFIENTRVICADHSKYYDQMDCTMANNSKILECLAYKEGLYKTAKSNGPLACPVESKYLVPAGKRFITPNSYSLEATAQADEWIDNCHQIKTKVGGTESFKYSDPEIVRTKISFVYKGHYVRACKKCNANRERNTWSLDNIRRTLYKDFSEGLKTYSLHNTILTSWDNGLGVQTNK